MSLQLELDSQRHVQEHLNELTSRTTLVLVFTALSTLFWVTQIDAVLNALLVRFNPCESGCLNLFDPAQWSAVRWMSSVILGILTVIPLAFNQGWKFARPGLLPSEQQWVKAWFFRGTIALLAAMLTTVGFLFPFLFELGHQTHESVTLQARYDAVHMLSMAVAVVWTQVVVACALSAMIIAGSLGMLNKTNADWWRLRVYGIVLLLMLASLPEYGGFALLLSVASVLVIERGSRRWLYAEPAMFAGKKPVMDAEGGIRNMLLVDCSCGGAAQPIADEMQSPLAVQKVYNLCASVREQENVLQNILQHRLTDVFISGCSSEPLPNGFKTNCASLGCNLRGLDLLAQQSYRTLPSPFEITEVELKLATLEDPWSKQSIPHRVQAVLERNLGVELLIETRDASQSWGTQLNPKQVLLHLDHLTSASVEAKVRHLPIPVIQK